MDHTNIPGKFNIPFGNGAGGSYIRTIPQASQIGIQAGAASLTDGFPPVCFLPIGAGGTPPFGQDMNGILQEVSAWCRWISAGGGVPTYDGAFAAAIGGYPSGAMLQSATTPGTFWISTADNNVNNPDSAPTNWLSFPGTSIIAPSRIVTASATLNVSADTDCVIYLERTVGVAAMQVNLAASGTLKTNQPFEVYDLSYNFDTAPVTVALPSTHTFPNGQNSIVMNQAGQGAVIRYAGAASGNKWSFK